MEGLSLKEIEHALREYAKRRSWCETVTNRILTVSRIHHAEGKLVRWKDVENLLRKEMGSSPQLDSP
jgi:hypothetical protein